MTSLNRTPPKTFQAWARPRYPRAVGLGALLLATACSRSPSDHINPDDGTGGSVPVAPAGSVATVIDEAAVPDASPPGAADASPDGSAAVDSGKPLPQPMPPPRLGGAKPAPFDSPE